MLKQILNAESNLCLSGINLFSPLSLFLWFPHWWKLPKIATQSVTLPPLCVVRLMCRRYQRVHDGCARCWHSHHDPGLPSPDAGSLSTPSSALRWTRDYLGQWFSLGHSTTSWGTSDVKLIQAEKYKILQTEHASISDESSLHHFFWVQIESHII